MWRSVLQQREQELKDQKDSNKKGIFETFKMICFKNLCFYFTPNKGENLLDMVMIKIDILTLGIFTSPCSKLERVVFLFLWSIIYSRSKKLQTYVPDLPVFYLTYFKIPQNTYVLITVIYEYRYIRNINSILICIIV
jgi:hypothetical protein